MTPLQEQELDPRIHAVNEERGVVEPALAQLFPAFRVLTPRPASAAGQFGLHARPDELSPQVTEALHGEGLEILEELEGGWAWIRTVHDGYLGYSRNVGTPSTAPPAHPVGVQALRAHLFAAPSIKAAVLDRLSYGAALDALDSDPAQHGDYLWWRVGWRGGEAYLHHAATLPEDADRRAFALRFVDVPYLWGGRSAWGLDCSGLAQLYAGRDAAGRSRLPRDADQQQATTLPVQTPQAGDLAFFPGHVGIMLDERRMLHANATHMRVTVETLGEGDYGRRLASSLTGYGRLKL